MATKELDTKLQHVLINKISLLNRISQQIRLIDQVSIKKCNAVVLKS